MFLMPEDVTNVTKLSWMLYLQAPSHVLVILS